MGRRILAAALLLLAHALPAWGSALGDLLARADSVRSSDVRQFRALLAQARTLDGDATRAERELFEFLQAHEQIVLGNYPAGIAVAKRLARDAGDMDLRYRAALLIANTGALTRDYPDGLHYLSEALAMERKVRDPAIRQLGLAVAATLYNQLGEAKLARAYAERQIKLGGTPRVLCAAHENRVRAMNALADTGGIPDAVFDQAIAACDAAKEPIGVYLVIASRARHLQNIGEPAEAIELLRNNLDGVRDVAYGRLTAEYYGQLTDLHFADGDLEAAERTAQQIVALDGKDPHWMPLATAYRVLYLSAKRKGELGRALNYMEEYHAADKTLVDDAQAREYAMELARHQALEREQQAAVLTHQNRALTAEKRALAESARAMRLAIVLMGLAIAVVAYWAWHSRRTHRVLRRLSQTDSLTGLATRRHFGATAARLLSDCEQRQRPLSVLLLDIDHFKRINDECGHAVGDWVLKQVADIGRGLCPERDAIGRLGGEEFALALSDLDIDQAAALAEGFRRAIGELDYLSGGCHVPVTASIGVACTSHSGYGYQKLLSEADRAMYMAKQAGRNRVASAVPPTGYVPGPVGRAAENDPA
ncbi:GGDEF domain-containing protein [Lysobacter xinjiangensis]|uniref:diguanylate cyclase n=2 Tax=Cognatilysobacter xinjiangensis TaxID=546892 RepID=A0ABQ3BSA9_9GAMM|nr:GGDEF domain-containing protein [Lysobacter xinjiangensis]